MEKTEGNLHWQIVQNLMEGFDEDRALTEIADDICSLLSQRIKAKALKDEQIKSIKKQAFEEWSESPEYSQAWSGGEFSFRQLRDQIYDRAVAAAQLQAGLGELE